jgi:hypothetical protein
VPDENPFSDVGRAIEEMIARHLDQVRAIDRADVDVNSWEASFLDSVLKQLENEKKPLTQKQLDVVRNMCTRYEIDFDL